MLVQLLKSKIHRATVTGASLHYEGSLTIARDLMEKAGLRPYERILVGNLSNGNRFETYVIQGPPRSGSIELNGAVAHLGRIGHKVTIMSFAAFTPAAAKRWRPQVLVLGPKNRIVSDRGT